MSRNWKRTLFTLASAALLFQAGSTLASGASNCYSVNIDNCVQLDGTIEDTCCANVDGTLRIATCTRDELMCATSFDEWTPDYSNGYNCHDIGDPCQ